MTWQWKFIADIKGTPGDVSLYGPAWAPQRNVSASADLNTFRTPGVHRITTPDTGTILNMPPGTRVASELENITTGTGSDSIFTQRLTESGDSARTWWRSAFTSGGTFTPWALSGTQAVPVTEWHVFLAVGQSNMSGRGIVSTATGGKYAQPRVAQFGFSRRVLETATIPLDMHDTPSGLSPASVFANNYLRSQPDNVGVLLVPAAHGSTGFTTSTTSLTWTPNAATDPTLDLPAIAVKQTQDAITAAKATGASVNLKGILWHQGENNSTMSTATYAANLDALIAYFRAQLGDANLPFLVGQMTPEGIAATTGRANVDAAQQQTPSRVLYTGFAPATTDGYNPGDTTHMSKKGLDFLGRSYLDAYNRALSNDGGPLKWATTAGRTAYALNPLTGLDQLVYGDTGMRSVTPIIAGSLYLRRFGALVYLVGSNLRPTSVGTNVVFALPSGFRPQAGTSPLAVATTDSGGPVNGYAVTFSPYNIELRNVVTANGFVNVSGAWATADPWPTTLPGTAVGGF